MPLPARSGSRISVTVALLTVVCALSIGAPASGQAPVSEFAIKSAFLTRFLQFVEWTPPRHAQRRSAVIAILGVSAFCDQLPAALGKLPPEDGAVTVFRESQPDKAASADVVFVCESERPRLGSLVRTLEDGRALTIAESSGFGSGGVMLNLYVGPDRRVHFEANTNAAARAGIRMSSHLLRMARIVG